MLGLRHYKGRAIDLFQGDLTTFVCDAMVNAANEALAGGGGVDGAIHRVGGPEIMAECRRLGACATGAAVVTKAGALPASYVIHAVGPVWQGGRAGEEALLSSAYRAALQQALQLGIRHVALPSLSTGAYAFPLDLAAPIAIRAVREMINGMETTAALKRMTFVLFDKEHYHAFQKALFDLFPED